MLVLAAVIAWFALAACSLASDRTKVCPDATIGTQFLKNEEQGYCMLYPIGYEVTERAETEMVVFVGSLLDVTHPKLFIGVQDVAGCTAEQVVDELQANVQKSMPGYSEERTFGLWVGYKPA